MNIGIVGIGTVGEGVLNLLSKERKSIEKRIGEEVNILWICDKKIIQREGVSFTSDYEDIIDDPRVDTVIELIGGDTHAFTLAEKVLTSRKNLITANKHLLATRGRELFALAARHRVKIFYEAAVAGGIPAVSTMFEGTFPGGITSIRGILNGTANYILSQMEEGATYDQAVRKAQENGYAEANPSFDVKGIDTGHKICLLSQLVWGEFIDFEGISIKGIEEITLEDIDEAKAKNQRIKLIGEAVKEGNSISIRVAPVTIEATEQLYNTMGAYNAIETEGVHLGKTILYGMGAGMYPTASAVISDLYKVVNSRTWQR